MKKAIPVIVTVPFILICMIFISCNHVDPLGSITPTAENTSSDFTPVEGFVLDREFFDKESSIRTADTRFRDTLGYGDYIYLRESGTTGGKNISTMVKYNIETWEKSVVCPDPICNHRDESGCFFARDFYIHEIKDDIIYYTGCYKKSEIKGLGSKYDENGNYVGNTKEDLYATYLHPFYAFNIKTGEREFLFEFHSTYNYKYISGDPIIAITDDKIYFREISFLYETVGDEELMYDLYNVGCFDRKSKKTETLFEYNRQRFDNGGSAYVSTGMHPYMYDEKSNTFFFIKEVTVNNYDWLYATYAVSLNDESFNFKEIYSNGQIVGITEDGNYVAETKVKRDSVFTDYDLILIDAETGKETVLLEKFLFSEYAFCGDYVMNVPYKYSYYTGRDGEKGGSSEFGDDLVLVNYKTLEKIIIPIANAFKDSTYTYVGPGISPNFYRGRVLYRYFKHFYNEYGESLKKSGFSDIMLDYATGKYIVFQEEKFTYYR